MKLKHLKSINEYRTMGFRYSDPTDKFDIALLYQGELDQSILEEVLKDYRIDFESIEINDKKVETENGISDGYVVISVLVYTDKEINDVVDTIIKHIRIRNKVTTLGVDVQPG